MVDGKDKGTIVDNNVSLKSGEEFFFVIRSYSKNQFKLFKKPTAEEEAKNAEIEMELQKLAVIEESKKQMNV